MPNYKKQSETPPTNSTQEESNNQKPTEKLTLLDSLKTKQQLDISDLEFLDDLKWDAAIVSDGSGTTFLDRPIGWASVLIIRDGLKFVPNCGSMSFGTNNLAELMAVVQPLMFLAEHYGPVLERFSVVVVSDSKYVSDGINKPFSLFNNSHKKHRELWAAIEMSRRQGFDIVGRHIKRSTAMLNIYAHLMANRGRELHTHSLKREKLDGIADQAKADAESRRKTKDHLVSGDGAEVDNRDSKADKAVENSD